MASTDNYRWPAMVLLHGNLKVHVLEVIARYQTTYGGINFRIL